MKKPSRPLPPLPLLLSGVRLLAGGQRAGRSLYKEQRANGDTNDDEDDDEEDEERGRRQRRGEERGKGKT